MIDKVKEEKTVECISKNTTDNSFWIDLKTIKEETDLPLTDIKELILESDMFVQNREGQITTRQIYLQKESFVNKLLNSFKNKID